MDEECVQDLDAEKEEGWQESKSIAIEDCEDDGLKTRTDEQQSR